MAVSVGDDVDAGDLLCLIKVSRTLYGAVLINPDHADRVCTGDSAVGLTMTLDARTSAQVLFEALAANPSPDPVPAPLLGKLLNPKPFLLDPDMPSCVSAGWRGANGPDTQPGPVRLLHQQQRRDGACPRASVGPIPAVIHQCWLRSCSCSPGFAVPTLFVASAGHAGSVGLAHGVCFCETIHVDGRLPPRRDYDARLCTFALQRLQHAGAGRVTPHHSAAGIESYQHNHK